MSTSPAAPPPSISIIPLLGIGEIRPGDDLVEALLPSARSAGIQDGDVLCISTKIVSKSLGLVISPEERAEAIERAAVRTVARRRHTRVVTSVVQIPSGPVMAAAGVDGSNAPGGPLLLPEDPDACARTLLDGLTRALGLRIGVILTDTSSRVWRVGVGDIALGAAGVSSLQDLRGGTDADGRELSVTVRALADELAAAADLAKGKASAVPAAIVRGAEDAVAEGEGVPARALSRTGEDDWFRRPSLESVWQAMGLGADEEPVARMSPEPDEERIARAVDVAQRGRGADGPHAPPASPPPRIERTAPHTITVHPSSEDAAGWASAGAMAERLRTALGAEEIASPLPPISITVEEES